MRRGEIREMREIAMRKGRRSVENEEKEGRGNKERSGRSKVK